MNLILENDALIGLVLSLALVHTKKKKIWYIHVHCLSSNMQLWESTSNQIPLKVCLKPFTTVVVLLFCNLIAALNFTHNERESAQAQPPECRLHFWTHKRRLHWHRPWWRHTEGWRRQWTSLSLDQPSCWGRWSQLQRKGETVRITTTQQTISSGVFIYCIFSCTWRTLLFIRLLKVDNSKATITGYKVFLAFGQCDKI